MITELEEMAVATTMQTEKICSRCIYHGRIPHISFDSDGLCNYCLEQEQLEEEYPAGKEGWRRLEQLATEIRRDGKGKKYDVVVGISGGCDSSYLLYIATQLGLRPLAVHFDNTWNSKIAVENIHNLLNKLNVDLYTYVVDNKEICDIFKSFMKASVPDIDTPSDIGLAATHHIAAAKYGIKYIFQGHSFRTEGITPLGWIYMDAKYIKSIQAQFGTYALDTFPNLWMSRWLKWIVVNRIKMIRPLYYIDFKKEETKKFLSEKFGWKWYGGHHMENRMAYFTNNYWLPRKANIDLRYPEFASQVRSGQMSREQALEEVAKPHEFDNEILIEVKKRLNLSDQEFDEMMTLPLRTYLDYKTYKKVFERMKWFFWVMYKMNLVPKSFYVKYTKRY